MISSHMSCNRIPYPSDHAVTWGHVTSELHFTFIFQTLLPLNLIGWWLKINLLDSLTNIRLDFCFLTEFWLNWKNCSSEDSLLLKHFHFCINFTNSLKNICEPSCFKNSGSQSGRKFLINTTVKFQVRNLNMIYKISQTENKEQKMIHPWFFQTSNSTQVCLSHLMLLLLAILIFWYFDTFVGNCSCFSQRCLLNSYFHVAHMCSFLHFFFCFKAKKWSYRQNLY